MEVNHTTIVARAGLGAHACSYDSIFFGAINPDRVVPLRGQLLETKSAWANPGQRTADPRCVWGFDQVFLLLLHFVLGLQVELLCAPSADALRLKRWVSHAF